MTKCIHFNVTIEEFHFPVSNRGLCEAALPHVSLNAVTVILLSISEDLKRCNDH